MCEDETRANNSGWGIGDSVALDVCAMNDSSQAATRQRAISRLDDDDPHYPHPHPLSPISNTVTHLICSNGHPWKRKLVQLVYLPTADRKREKEIESNKQFVLDVMPPRQTKPKHLSTTLLEAHQQSNNNSDGCRVITTGCRQCQWWTSCCWPIVRHWIVSSVYVCVFVSSVLK